MAQVDRFGLIRAAGAVVLLAGCQSKAPPKAPPPPEVAVVTVKPEEVPETYEFSAEVVPYRRVEVRSRIEGIIEARVFTEGATVRRGQVLYRLERVRPEAAYRSALARRNNAKRTLDRLEPLLADRAIAQQDVDNARAEFESAEGALEDAKKDLDDSVIRAEIDGRVGRALFDRGGRVTGTDDLLTTIDVLDPAYVVFRPSAQQLLAWQENPRGRALVQPGSRLRVEVTLPDGTLLPRSGRLNFVAPSLDATTGTQEFRAEFRNPDRVLLPGQFVRVRLSGFVRDSAIAVPQRAVQQALGRQFVYVVGQGDTVVSRDVQPGPWSGSRWIIEKGLASGDRVVVDGAQKAAPGGRVRPVPAVDSAATSEAASAGAARAATPGAKQ
ncbi:MAG TPA: efflux RND transporter periplasmic adaptor subunit [Gemmatimonadales bacterium]|nr:efflux RND transporter periplasmic adaptor subunit [Gemmatimonadales bacterium]